MNQRTEQSSDQERSNGVDAEVQSFLLTGDHDPGFSGWPGISFVDAAMNAKVVLRTALVAGAKAPT